MQVAQHKGASAAVGRRIPAVLVIEIEHHLARSLDDLETLTRVVELSLVGTEDGGGDRRITQDEGGGIFGEDEARSGGEGLPGEDVSESGRES